MDSIFREGGPHKVRRIGRDQYEMRISIPTDSDGMTGHECPNAECSPGYFKVKPGTGITDGQTSAFCPYCRHNGEPSDFYTSAQVKYAEDLAMAEVSKGVDRMVQSALGLGPSGRKKIGGGLFSMELSYKPERHRPIPPPLEEELRRNILCPSCGLEHAVFGLATWCPDCGQDVFLTHVEEEFATVRKILAAIDSRRASLGARVAARDLENALEDTVTIFESVLKVITRRFLLSQGKTQDEIEEIISKHIRNRYQSIPSAGDTFRSYVGVDLFSGIDGSEVSELRRVFEGRHPITHNLGIVDRKYLERVQSGELPGRDLRISVPQVERAVEIASTVLSGAYRKLFLSE